LDLEAVLREPALPAEAGIVDETVDRHLAAEERVGTRADRCEVTEVELDEFDVVVAGLALDLIDDGFGLGLRAACEDHVRTLPSDLACGDLADPGVRTGDDECLASERLRHGERNIGRLLAGNKCAVSATFGPDEHRTADSRNVV